MIGVGWTGLYYQWTPNNVALGIVMVAAAWWATKIVSGDRRVIISSLCVASFLLADSAYLAECTGQRRVYMSGTHTERPS